MIFRITVRDFIHAFGNQQRKPDLGSPRKSWLSWPGAALMCAGRGDRPSYLSGRPRSGGVRSAELSALIGRVVTGVERVRPVELLPMERRRMQLHSVFSAISDPLLAVDGANRITQANPAAADAAACPMKTRLRERRLTDFSGAKRGRRTARRGLEPERARGHVQRRYLSAALRTHPRAGSARRRAARRGADLSTPASPGPDDERLADARRRRRLQYYHRRRPGAARGQGARPASGRRGRAALDPG